MNIGGFSPAASSTIYKTFIRPVMEYGLPLKVFPASSPISTTLQKAQNFALRLTFSAHRTTSINALQKLLLIAPMTTRNQVLNIQFAARLHNSKDLSIPAVRIWRHCFEQNDRGTTAHCTRKNPLFSKAHFLPILTTRLVDAPSIPEKAWSQAHQKQLVKTALERLDLGKSNIAGTLYFDPSKHFRTILTASDPLPPTIRIPIFRWLVGNVAVHRPCQSCNAEISRSHAVTCSGADAELQLRYPAATVIYYLEDTASTFLDFLLNQYAYSEPTKTPAQLYEHIATAISLIYSHCLGYQQKENGFHAPPEDSQGSQRYVNSSLDSTREQSQEPPDPG